MAYRDIIFVFAVTAATLLGLFLMLLYLIVRKSFERRHQRNVEQMKETYSRAMLSYLMTGERSRHLEANSYSAKMEALEQLLVHYSGTLQGDGIEERTRLYAERVFLPFYRKRLDDRHWSVRMNTLSRIGRFKMSALRDELVRRFLSPPRQTSEAEKVKICSILSALGDPAVEKCVLENKVECSGFQRRGLLHVMDDRLFGRFSERFDELPAGWKYAVVDIIGIRRDDVRLPLLRRLLDSPDEELRIRALKAMSQVSLLAPDESYLRHAEAVSWQERMMAAKLFGAMRSPRFLDCLKRLIFDESWLVRYQAAQSIAAIAGGRRVLSDIAHRATDPYVRDIAAEWLQRGEPDGLDY